MGIKQIIEEVVGWVVANGGDLLIGLLIVGVGVLVFVFVPRYSEKKFEKTDAGKGYLLMKEVGKVEKQQAEMAVLLKKSRGSWPYIFTNAEKKQAASEDLRNLTAEVERANEAIDAQMGVFRDGEAV